MSEIGPSVFFIGGPLHNSFGRIIPGSSSHLIKSGTGVYHNYSIYSVTVIDSEGNETFCYVGSEGSKEGLREKLNKRFLEYGFTGKIKELF